MKTTILKKLLTVMVLLTVVPLMILGIMAMGDAKQVGLDAAEDARNMGETALADSTNALNSLGEDIIKQKAIDVAKQIEIYLKGHPGMTVKDLQADDYFQAIAVQPVGKTGYTAVTDVDTLTCRFHASPKIVDLDLSTLSGKLPGFWGVMSRSERGRDVYGYYDWLEADGSIKQKYMYIAVVGAETADGVVFTVAATTYIDEFNQPVVEIGQKINSQIAGTVAKIRDRTENLNLQNEILLVMVATIFFVLMISYMFAQSLTMPIKKLKEAADRVTSGEYDAPLPPVKSQDEVGLLTGSVEMLIAAFRARAPSPVPKPQVKPMSMAAPKRKKDRKPAKPKKATKEAAAKKAVKAKAKPKAVKKGKKK